MKNPLNDSGYPDPAAQQQRQQHGGAAHVLGAFGKVVPPGPMRSIAVSIPVLSSSTIITITTEPASKGDLYPAVAQPEGQGNQYQRARASWRKAVSCQPAFKPSME